MLIKAGRAGVLATWARFLHTISSNHVHLMVHVLRTSLDELLCGCYVIHTFLNELLCACHVMQTSLDDLLYSCHVMHTSLDEHLPGCHASESGAPPFDEAKVPLDKRRAVEPEQLWQVDNFLISTFIDG